MGKYIKRFDEFIKEAFGDDVLNSLNIKDAKDELTEDEMYTMMRKIIKKYYTGEDMRRQVHFGRLATYEYWLPMAAKADLDAIGYKYYEIEKSNNKEHKDYGKSFVVVTSGDVNKKEDGF